MSFYLVILSKNSTHVDSIQDLSEDFSQLLCTMVKSDLKMSPCSEKLTLGENTTDSSCDPPTVPFPFEMTLKEAAAVGSVFLTPTPCTGPH